MSPGKRAHGSSGPPPVSSGGGAAASRGRTSARPALGSGARAGGRGALSQSQGQANVRTLIEKMNRGGSPAKRQREISPDDGSSETSLSDQPAEDGEHLSPIERLLRKELRKQTALLTKRFESATESLKQEMRHMQERIVELERHVSDQGDTLHQLQDAVNIRDHRIADLEDEVEDLRRVSNLPCLIFDGPGVPVAPETESWKEDVVGTTKDMKKKIPAKCGGQTG